MSLRDKINQADDLRRETVEVPEWGVTVCIQELNGVDREKYATSTVEIEGTKVRRMNIKEMNARLVAMSMFDPETKERVYPDEAIPELNKKSGVVLERLATIAQRLSGLNKNVVKEIEKN